MRSRIKTGKISYENVQIETANGLEINVDFTLNTLYN
jgi:hypothetical protein